MTCSQWRGPGWGRGVRGCARRQAERQERTRSSASTGDGRRGWGQALGVSRLTVGGQRALTRDQSGWEGGQSVKRFRDSARAGKGDEGHAVMPTSWCPRAGLSGDAGLPP